MRRRRRRRTMRTFLMTLCVLAFMVLAYLSYLEFKPMVVKAVTIEAGSPMLDVKEFLLEKEMNGKYVTDISNLDLNAPGTYEIKIKVRNRIHTSSLEVVDSTAPYGEPAEVTALLGEEVQAGAFINRVEDATSVTVEFTKEPDTSTPGVQEVSIILMDTSGNSTKLTSKLNVLDVKSRIQVEAGSNVVIRPEDFLKHDDVNISFVKDISALDLSKPVTHEIQIKVDDRLLTSYIEVVDTTPPTGMVVNQTAWKDEPIEASAFVTDVYDLSGVQFSYKVSPDFTVVGDQEVTIQLIDSYGNTSELPAILTVMEDTEPPVFSGIKDKTIYEGEGVAYKKNITVLDNKDGELSFQVDSSGVKLKTPGVYTVYYSAVDAAGNTAEVSSKVTVLEFLVTDEMINELADDILGDITTEGMTKREIAYAIYKYVKGHVAYTGDSDKSSTKNEAFRGIKNGVGDCFTYYAVSEILLTRAGIDNMRVTRVGGRTKHFWNLINCGDGWYHFDSCPHKDKIESFMLTDAEVEAYTKKRGNNYYTFDTSLYPATPEE